MSQPQDSEPAFVSTPDELVDAIVDDRRHIVVTAHLDLTYLPLRQNSICVDGCASPIPEIRATQSIRGNCPNPPTARDVAVLAQTQDAVALLPFQAGQCLIVTFEDMFPVLSPDFWMDSLYLRMAYLKIAPRLRPRQYTTLLGVQPPQRALRGSARRFITRTTFQGDGGSPTVGVWADDSTYIENCTFANLGGNGEEENNGNLCARCSAAVNAAQAHVTAAACTFLDPVPLPGATYIRAWHNSRVLDSGCVFAPTPRLQLAPFKLEAGARIYSDNSRLRIRSDPGNLLIGPLPTSAAAQASPGITRWGLSGVAGDFLQRDDPWFVQIQSDLNATVLPEPAYMVGPNPVPLFDLESAVAADAVLPSDGSAAGGGGVPPGLIGIIAGIALLLSIVLVLGCVLWRGKRQTKSRSDQAAAGSASRDMKVSTASGSDAGLALGHSTSHGQKSQRAGSSVAASAYPPSAGPSSGSTAAHVQGVHLVPHEDMPQPPAPGAATPVLLAWINSQLDWIAPQQVVMHQYKLLGPSTRRQGARSVVAAATGAYAATPFVLKFFADRADFDAELAVRAAGVLQGIAPPIFNVHDPAKPPARHGGVADGAGRPLPPCIVMPAGESLTEWLRRASPDVFQAATVMVQIAACLRDIHAAGYVHLAVKPAHVILLRQQNRWSLTDFDRAAPIASEVPPVATLPYGTPEAMGAACAGHAAIAADPAADAWALGVLAFELLTGQQALPQHPAAADQMAAQLRGGAPLPWEGEAAQRLGCFRQPVLALLARDPAQRATAQSFHTACNAIVISQTTSTMPHGVTASASRALETRTAGYTY